MRSRTIVFVSPSGVTVLVLPLPHAQSSNSREPPSGSSSAMLSRSASNGNTPNSRKPARLDRRAVIGTVSTVTSRREDRHRHQGRNRR